MISPPDAAIAEAVAAARLSPCAKSKRGVSFFSRRTGVTFRGDFNGPPEGFSCSGSDTCKAHCRKVAVHAEERAIMGILGEMAHLGEWPDLVHVKVVNGELVPSGPPSCLQCSRLVAEVGVGVWLYEGTPRHERDCIHCKYTHVFGPTQDTADDRDNCPNCGQEMHPVSKTYYEEPATWRRYDPDAFHLATLRFHGLMRTRTTL